MHSSQYLCTASLLCFTKNLTPRRDSNPVLLFLGQKQYFCRERVVSHGGGHFSIECFFTGTCRPGVAFSEQIHEKRSKHYDRDLKCRECILKRKNYLPFSKNVLAYYNAGFLVVNFELVGLAPGPIQITFEFTTTTQAL
jgi:hypothetical protein